MSKAKLSKTSVEDCMKPNRSWRISTGGKGNDFEVYLKKDEVRSILCWKIVGNFAKVGTKIAKNISGCVHMNHMAFVCHWDRIYDFQLNRERCEFQSNFCNRILFTKISRTRYEQAKKYLTEFEAI